jgi:hypothetical protein
LHKNSLINSFDKSKELDMEFLKTTCKLTSADRDKLLTNRGGRLNRKTIFFSSLIIFLASLTVSCEKDNANCYIDDYGDYVCDSYRKPSDTSAPGIK